MEDIYIMEIEGKSNVACENMDKVMHYLRSTQLIDYDRELTEYIYQSNNVAYLRKMWSINWQKDIHDWIEDKMKIEIEKYGFGKSYTGNIIVKKIMVFEPSK